MLFNYFCKKQVLRGTFGEIWRIQIQIYPKTYVELKYGTCYLKNKVSAHRLGLVVPRAPKNLKLAGNGSKVAAMCGLQNHQKTYICSFQTKYPYYRAFFSHLFGAFRAISPATTISCSSFWLVDTYFWSYCSWLAKSGCQNLKLAGNTFPPLPSFWSPGGPTELKSSSPFHKYNAN